MARYQKGVSGNPHGRPPRKPPSQESPSGAQPAPDPSADTRSTHEQNVDRLVAIRDSPDAEPTHVLMAVRLLEMIRVNDIKVDEHQVILSRRDAAIAEVAAELAKAERLAAAHEEVVTALLEEWPELSRERAEDFLNELDEAVLCEKRKVSLTNMLERTLLGHPEPKVSNARRTELIEELYRRYGLNEEPEQPQPRCGLIELPPPDPDREYLAAQAVERERRRRELVKHPAAAPSPPAKVEAEPTEPPVMPTHLDSRIITFGDLAIFPGLGE
jgi:hypothetical protein